MLDALRVPIGWGQLLKRTAREVVDDDCLGLAAQLAFYFFLALFPAFLFILALGSLFPVDDIRGRVVDLIGPVVSPGVLEIVERQLTRLAEADNRGVLTFGVVGALWSSSAAVVAIVRSLNRAYDIEEGRPWWKVRLIAIGVTLVLAAFLLTSLTLVLAGPLLAGPFARALGLGAEFEWIWTLIQWPLAILLVSTAIAFVFYLAPDAEQDWTWVSPGALVATVLWLIVSLIFKYYVANFAAYNIAYGTLGGVIVLLLWFYLSGLALLVGAELNAEIEHASPYGKNPGEKVPGRRPIGRRAARLFREKGLAAVVPASSQPVQPPPVGQLP